MGRRSYEVTRTIEASADDVWALLTDADTYPAWNRAVISIDGPIVEGASIRLVSMADPKRTFTLEVAEMTAPTRMVWTDGMPLGLFSGRRTYTITNDDPAVCEFTMAERFSGLLAGLLTRVIPDLTESFETFADGLKTAAEARSLER
ncbi:MAG: SRPBCC domain-containing protein [Thermoleophilia bacterium]|nr:SRPBCC domain-containing protein [Thermoleophilia bacterium]